MSEVLRRNCRGCGMPLIFIQGPEGRTVPLDTQAPVYKVERDLTGVEVAVRVEAFVSHFASYPKASDLSRSKRSKV